MIDKYSVVLLFAVDYSFNFLKHLRELKRLVKRK